MPFQFRKEAIEEDLNTNFPSQGQGNPPLYYSLSEVVVPTYNINPAAEGSTLPTDLQRAWDFSTGHNQLANSSANIITNTGFWKIDLTLAVADLDTAGAPTERANVSITDGLTSKQIWAFGVGTNTQQNGGAIADGTFFVFVRSGDTVTASTNNTGTVLNVWYRQVADLNGNLVNPLGYSAA